MPSFNLESSDMTLIILILSHFIGDYALQNDYIALNKGKDNYVLFAHVAIWTFTLSATAIYLKLPITAPSIIGILLIPHFIIDYIKARNLLWCKSMKPTYSLYVDQLLHLVQICTLYFTLTHF